MYSNHFAALTCEYTRLQGELEHRLGWFIQMFSIYLGGVAVLYGTASPTTIHWISLLVPLLSLAMYWRMLWDQIVVRQLTIAMGRAATRINGFVAATSDSKGQPDSPMQWDIREPFADQPRYYKYSLACAYLAGGCLPAVAFGFWGLTAPLLSLGNSSTTMLAPSTAHSLALAAEGISVGAYILFKTVRTDF
ncbi:MAG: hypothetical protein AAFU38_18700 [Bacteroidota bacterium]